VCVCVCVCVCECVCVCQIRVILNCLVKEGMIFFDRVEGGNGFIVF
jgi:hypothetical protein